ncbi:TPA: DNA-protecting protein DprA [Enterococcus faecalis]|uniref:DNA-processing protein DprA n=1 Tax=Enterococcus TaxID=1350 RepID=UPI00032DA4AB|nr:DNA-processing protein DprA [Enterococcus faecalis]EHD3888331.1 DNA-protecting protein DprA [Enterococcus faecalis]EOM24206.1 DNA protecting protein DprA [Enterococcus faecalis EnGen0253]EOM29385.1 DNA protecting protein DprA [Enterococcus faecalis EnGen0232]MCU2202296.1 DNA-processing protein DprA [Enterococcus faecalis]MCU2273752.1 DNA-processing protein DprA [Enterococcus faecalis]
MEILQRQLLFKLAVCQGIGNLGILKVLQEAIAQKRVDFSSTEIIRIAEIKKYRELFEQSWLHHKIHSEALYIRQCQHQFMTILDAVYPKLLREIYNPPAILFYRGNLQLLSRRKIGIVGARYATSYGLRVTEALVPKIVKEGFTIVSGLAKGIDSRSHEMAIQNGGQTIGILGTGLDVYYPYEKKELQQTMKQNQLVLTEYVNGSGPKKYHFPARNRIIAGLSLGVCVMEARKNSGSLITAQAAMDYGREVFAVPGSIFQSFSTGCHELIQDGAKCVQTIDDICEEL